MNKLMTQKSTGKLWALAVAMMFTMVGTDGLVAQTGDWKAPRRSARKRNPMRKDASAVLAGKAIYNQNCLACHGNTGKGDGPASAALNPKPRDLTSPQVIKQKDGELYWKIQNGRSPMPAFGSSMSRKQIWQVVSYLRRLENGTAPAAPKPVTDARSSVTSLLDQYFDLQSQLKVSGWDAKARGTASKLARTASSMGELAKGDKKQKALWAAQKADVARGANQLLAAKNAEPVAAFEIITKALDSLVRTFGHGETEAVSLFVCKMGKDKAGSTWLQKGKKVMNPFPWGKKMPGCGEELKSYAPPAKIKSRP